MEGVEVRRSADRFATVAPATPDAAEGWALTRHSFSFGEHYDPDRVGFGSLLALNDETVRAGTGYPEHTHRDVEIVTWVVSGELRHADTAHPDDSVATIEPGEVQGLSAGSGVTHAEGAAADADVRFVQTWIRPDAPGGTPSYVVGGFKPAYLASTWVAAASGSDPTAVVDLRSRGTTLWVTRLETGEERTLPASASAYVLLARGAVDVDGVGPLDEGDALELTVPAPLRVVAREPAEILAWTFA
ncbi:pirin family protein [Microlunatus antarcticus]|uniref:Pirin N-terminal domain-containing protein n=1 Tax=Microlunatus antarcticus TaxID=53388 RepID=A0A7W5JXM7_9ACTN|nr:hypothetical protein [Microlunatus antarcticus]